MSSGDRDSIPNKLRKTIQNIKEVAGNHGDEEIYVMLKECSMDPNETAQKLLFQDPFHEVRRKRDRKKENLSNKESAESRRRPGMQGRGSRGGKGNYSSRYISNDASSSRNMVSGKENGINQVSEKGIGSQEMKNKDIIPTTSSLTAITINPTAGSPGVTGLVNQSEGDSSIGISKLRAPPPPLHPARTKANPSIEFGKGQTDEKLASNLSNNSTTETQAPSPAVYFSASDLVLVPSHDSWVPGAVGAIKCEVGSKRMPVTKISLELSDGKSTDGQTLQKASEVGISSMQGNMPSKSMRVGKNQLSDSAQLLSSTHDVSSVIRPSSNNNSRSQQLIGPQKVGPTKEWKPKPNPNLARGSGKAGSSEAPTTVETNTHISVLDSKENTLKLQRKLEDLHIPDGQHVIIPNHLHVPEADKIGFCFGSFDASFVLNTSTNSGPENDSNTTPLSETSESVEETADQSSSDQNPIVTDEEGAYPDQPQSPRHVPENLSSGEGDASSTAVLEYSECKQGTTLPGNHQYSMLHTYPSYSFGFMPSTVGSQLAPFESSDSQARDASRVPSFIIPQLFDPASYYGHFYRSGADSDGRISPFHSSGVTTKYNGNVAILSPQTSQSAQEGGNSLVLSTAGPTLVTQAAGAMQSSMAVTQQPLPVFRQPTGMPIAHYHPNFVPYGPYFPPVYVPPPSIHPFLSNGTFPQQPQAGGIYAAPPGGAAKYSLPHYKVGSNTENSTHVAVAGNFGPYSSSPAGYNPSSTSTAGNSLAKEDLATSQFKESNVYISGQQSEGSTVWVAAPGQDISSLQANSFYNIPPQGQVAFTPPQLGHGTFPSIYHPAQTVSPTTVHPLLQHSQTMASAADIAGSTVSVYQQPQHAQINWPSNY